MRFSVDERLCTGHGVCEEIAPNAFEVRDDGIARACVGDVSGDLERQVRAAAAQCPARAILIENR